LRIGSEGASSEMPTPSLPSGYGLPDLHDVSTGTSEAMDLPRLENLSTSRRTDQSNSNTPKAKRNIFQPEASPSWNGLTDLRSTPLNAKFAKSKQPKPPSFPSYASNLRAHPKPKLSIVNALADLHADMEEEENSPPMSPPVTMAFNLPPRAQAIYSAGHTPVKQLTGQRSDVGDSQARMILDDLMEEMAYEPSPRMPTPEGLGRYSILPSDLANDPARQLFPQAQAHASSSQPRLSRRSVANTSFGSDIVDGPVSDPYQEMEESFDEDSFDSEDGQTMQPASQGIDGDLLGNESYMSQSPTHAGRAPSPTTSEAGMVFGKARVDDRGRSVEDFRIRKVDEMMTFNGGRMEDAGDAVAESPSYALAKNAR
jgi:DASH complex subunit ASK1